MLLALIFAAAFFDNRDPDPRRQFVHRCGKIDMFIIHHEPENTAARSASETMKGLALRTDSERRCFFLMKWTERLETCARPLQRKISSDHFHDIVRGRDLLDCLRRNRHLFARSSVLAVASLAREQPLPNFP